MGIFKFIVSFYDNNLCAVLSMYVCISGCVCKDEGEWTAANEDSSVMA